MLAVIYSNNKELSPEEHKSNTALACDVAEALRKKHDTQLIPICNISLMDKPYGKIFNLCDNNEGTGSGFLETVMHLEKHHYQFTGASSKVLYYFVNKQRWLQKLMRHPFLPANSFHCVHLKPPVILKHANLHGSEKLTMDNVLCKIPACIEPGTYLEEFVNGNEYSYCEVPGLFAATVKKQVSKNKICDFDFKWRKQTQEQVTLAKHAGLKKIVKTVKTAFHIKSYFRIDYRIKGGKIYVFDVNMNCYLGTDGTLMKAANLCGYSFEQVIEKILD